MAESSSSSSAAAPVKSDAETEEMLDRMLTRLALCDDSKLQSLLSKLLPISISSLSSQSVTVRKKVLLRKISLRPFLSFSVHTMSDGFLKLQIVFCMLKWKCSIFALLLCCFEMLNLINSSRV